MLLSGCAQESKVSEQPKITAADTMTKYLDALIDQDGMTMADLSVEHSGYDLTFTEADAQKLGMDSATASKFYEQLLNFRYTLEPETVNGDQAEIVAHITTYDLNQVLSDVTEAHKEEFAEIYDQDIEAEAKNQEIAKIIVDAMAEAERTYQFDFTFHLQLVDQEWLIVNEDGKNLFKELFSSE